MSLQPTGGCMVERTKTVLAFACFLHPPFTFKNKPIIYIKLVFSIFVFYEYSFHWPHCQEGN